MCECKIGSASDGNLMPIKCSKYSSYTHIIADLNKCIDTKVVLCMCNNLCIPQIGIWKVTLTYKVIKPQWSYFLVSRTDLALLGSQTTRGCSC